MSSAASYKFSAIKKNKEHLTLISGTATQVIRCGYMVRDWQLSTIVESKECLQILYKCWHTNDL